MRRTTIEHANKSNTARWLRAGALAILASPLAIAQGPGLQGGGQIERELRRVPQPKPARKALPAVVLPRQVRREDMDAIRLEIRAIDVAGNTVYPAAALDPLLGQYTGREVSLRELYDLADALSQKYQDDGYVLSQVVIPDQIVRDGKLELRAVEGYVSAVSVSGDLPADRGPVDAYAEAITRSIPLQAAVLERYLLLLNDLPGAVASAALTPPADQTGAAELSVQVGRIDWGGAVGINNLGSRSLGPWRLTADLDAYSLLRSFDYTGFRLVTTANRELDYVSLYHEQPVGSDGARINASVSAVESQIDATDTFNANLETRSRAAALGASYPLLRNRTHNLYLRGALTAHNGETTLSGFRPTRDRLRVLRLGLGFDAVDTLRGVNAIDIEVSQGLRGLGASANDSEELSRPHGRVDFAKLTVYAARLQSLHGPWSVLAALSAQYAFSDLLVPEQFAFGGEQFGRGYDAAEFVGDSGAAAKFELRYAGSNPGALLEAYTLYAYYDVGIAWLRTPLAEFGEMRRQSGASAGLGARMNLGERTSAFIEVAQPLTRDVAAERNRDARLFAGIALRF